MRTEIVLEMFITVKPGLIVVLLGEFVLCFAMFIHFIVHLHGIVAFVWYLFCVNDKGVSER